VTYARRLYERFTHLIHEAAKFGVVGGIGFVITEVGTNLLQVPLDWLLANTIATVVAACVTFAGNRYWTFRHRDRDSVGREYVIFFVLNAIGLGIQLAFLGFARYALGTTDKLWLNVALFVGIVFGTLFRFCSYRTWVWRAVPPPDAAGVAGLAPAGQPQLAAGPATTTRRSAARHARSALPQANGALPQANGHPVGDPATGVPPVRGETGAAESSLPVIPPATAGRHARRPIR
jgi:putative flippase GtrA